MWKGGWKIEEEGWRGGRLEEMNQGGRLEERKSEEDGWKSRTYIHHRGWGQSCNMGIISFFM